MIQGKSKTEQTYRAVNLDSASSLKDFSVDRKKYFRKHIMNEKMDDSENQAAVVGRIVETLLLEPEEFDGRFYLSSCLTQPTGLMLDFVEALYKFSSEATNDQGVVTRDFEDITEDAYVASKFKISKEAVLGKFIGSNAQIYYEEIRKVRTNNLTVVTTKDVTNAERIVENLKTNPVTKDVINIIDSERYTVLNQLQVENYEVDGHMFKSMLDKVIVDHKTKTIKPYDLKCTWSVEGFFEEYYLYRKSYIQAYLYYKAMVHLTKPGGPFEGYSVDYLKFIVCDSTNYYNPLIYTLSARDMIEAYEGFDHKGRTYTGVGNIIEDLKWALDNNTWNISRTNFEAKGEINIKS